MRWINVIIMSQGTSKNGGSKTKNRIMPTIDRQISTAARKMSKFPIVTQIGSSGFENSKNVIVVEDVEDTLRLLLEMVETKGRKL
jgi:hypothetical protein